MAKRNSYPVAPGPTGRAADEGGGAKVADGAKLKRPTAWIPEKPNSRGRPPVLVSQLLFGLQSYVAKETGAFLGHEQWRTVVGDRIAEHCRVGKMYQGTLTIQVASSAWCAELSFLEQDLLGKLMRAGYEVKKLRFVVDPDARDKSAKERRVRPMRASAPAADPLPEDLRDRIARIEDPNLRATIAAAARVSLSRQEPAEGRDPERGAGNGARPQDGEAARRRFNR